MSDWYTTPPPPQQPSPGRGLTDEQVRVALVALANGHTPTSIARELGCSPATICRIRDRKNYRDVIQRFEAVNATT